MSSLNSNNEFEGLEDPFGASDIASDNLQEGMSLDSEAGAPEGESEYFTPAPEEGDAETADKPAEDGSPEGLDFAEDAPAPEAEEPVAAVEYKKARCWDLYSWLLFIAWLALLAGILFLWLEVPPSEYGEPPYKETSVPVKTAS